MRADRGFPFLSDTHHSTLSVLFSIAIHAVISVLVVWPLITHNKKPVLFAVSAAIGGNTFDLDHVFEAGSLNPHTLETLGGRPDTHSLLFGLLLALIALAISRRPYIAWSVLAVIVAHLLWDSAGGGDHWAWPSSSPNSIPWLLCPLGIVVLLAVSQAIAKHRDKHSLPDADPVDQHLRRKVGGAVG